MDKCNAISCNTFDYLSDRICVPDKTEDVNTSVSNIITENIRIKNINDAYSIRLNVNSNAGDVNQTENKVMISVDMATKQ